METLTASIWDVHNGIDGVNISECTIAYKDGIDTPFCGTAGTAENPTVNPTKYPTHPQQYIEFHH
eukprot:UN08838